MSFYIKTIKGVEETGSILILELLKEEKYDSLEKASEYYSNEFKQRIEHLDEEIEDWEDFPNEYEVELVGEEIKVYSQFIGIRNTLKRIFFHVLLVPDEFNDEINTELNELTILN